MSKAFTTREKVLLVILAVLVLAVLYVKAVYEPVNAQVSEIQQQNFDAQDELLLAQTKAIKLKNMEKKLEELKAGGASLAEIPVYDNLKNVMLMLEDILRDTEDYNIAFSPVENDGSIVRRTVVLNFSARSYGLTRDIITAVAEGKYMCSLGDITFGGDLEGADVLAPMTVSMKVTFYESVEK